MPVEYISGVTPEALREVIPDVELGELLSPGRFRFKVPAGQHVSLNVMTNRADGFSVPVTTSLPVSSLSAAGAEGPDARGGRRRHGRHPRAVPPVQGPALRRPGRAHRGRLPVRRHARGGEGPQRRGEGVRRLRAGLYGVDVDEMYTAPSAGEYVIQVGQVSDAPTGYHLVHLRCVTSAISNSHGVGVVRSLRMGAHCSACVVPPTTPWPVDPPQPSASPSRLPSASPEPAPRSTSTRACPSPSRASAAPRPSSSSRARPSSSWPTAPWSSVRAP